jgi:hypothetical protein
VLFDGTQWTATTERGLMVSPTEGFRITGTGSASVVERGLSGVWTAQSPTLGAGDAFSFIDAVSPTDVVVISRKAAIFQWNGSTWRLLSPARPRDLALASPVYLGAGHVWINDSGLGGFIRSFDGSCWKDELTTNGGAVITGNRDRLWVWGPKLTGGTTNDLRTRVP